MGVLLFETKFVFMCICVWRGVVLIFEKMCLFVCVGRGGGKLFLKLGVGWGGG